MLKKDELKVLKLLFEDLTADLTINAVSKRLNQNYVQTYRTVYNLVKSGDIILKPVGKGRVAKLDLAKSSPSYVLAEIERTDDLCAKSAAIAVVKKYVSEIGKNFICILFGSQASKHKPNSDIDLLFILPEEFNRSEFERIANSKLTAANVDITIVPESSLHEMWSNPNKLNIGNELLKRHIVLYGAEHFLNLLRKHYVG